MSRSDRLDSLLKTRTVEVACSELWYGGDNDAMELNVLARSISLFALAGVAEIGGGYLMWLWLRENRPLWVGFVGAVVIVLYGVIPTWQPSTFDFGKVYAAYGGAFIALSLVWGWLVDGVRPDAPSVWGAGMAFLGAAIIVYWPRT